MKAKRKKKKNWIKGAIKRPGALRKKLGAKPGRPIPPGKVQAAAKKPGALGRQARLALMLKSFTKKKR